MTEAHTNRGKEYAFDGIVVGKGMGLIIPLQ